MLSLGIRAQLLALAVVCAIPGALGLGLYAATAWSNAVGTAQTRSYAVSKRVAATVDRGFSDYESLLNQLATRPRVRALNPADCDPLIRDYLPLHPELTAIALRDLDSKLICSSLANATRTLNPKEAALAAEGARTGAFKVVAVTRGEVTGRLVARMTYPVRNAEGVVTAELLAPLDLRTFGERVLSDLPENIVVTVVDEAGNILLRSRSARDWEGRPVPEPLWKLHDHREGHVRGVDVEGVPRIGAYVTVPATRWIVAARMSDAAALGPHRAATAVAALAGLACFAVAALAAWAIGRNISLPLHRLTVVTERFVAGGTSARAAEGGPREIRKLIRSVNGLLDSMAPRQ